MGCPPARGDNPRALASGLSYEQGTNMLLLPYTICISVDLAQYEIVRAIVGKGDITSKYDAADGNCLGLNLKT